MPVSGGAKFCSKRASVCQLNHAAKTKFNVMPNAWYIRSSKMSIFCEPCTPNNKVDPSVSASWTTVAGSLSELSSLLNAANQESDAPLTSSDILKNVTFAAQSFEAKTPLKPFRLESSSEWSEIERPNPVNLMKVKADLDSSQDFGGALQKALQQAEALEKKVDALSSLATKLANKLGNDGANRESRLRKLEQTVGTVVNLAEGKGAPTLGGAISALIADQERQQIKIDANVGVESRCMDAIQKSLDSGIAFTNNLVAQQESALLQKLQDCAPMSLTLQSLEAAVASKVELTTRLNVLDSLVGNLQKQPAGVSHTASLLSQLGSTNPQPPPTSSAVPPLHLPHGVDADTLKKLVAEAPTLLQLKTRLDDLTAVMKSDDVMVNGRPLKTLDEVADWCSRALPKHSFDCLVDPLVFASGFVHGDSQTGVAEMWSKLFKAKMRSKAEMTVLDSFQTGQPKFFHQGQETSTADIDAPIWNKLPSYENWVLPDKGMKAKLERRVLAMSNDVRSLIANRLINSPEARALAIHLLDSTVSFYHRIISWVSDMCETLMLNQFTQKAAWSLTVSCFKRVFDEMTTGRVGAIDQFAISLDDPSQSVATNTPIVVHAILKTHRVMNVFMRLDFKNHPAIAAQYTLFLVTHSRVEAVDSLRAQVKKLEADLKATSAATKAEVKAATQHATTATTKAKELGERLTRELAKYVRK